MIGFVTWSHLVTKPIIVATCENMLAINYWMSFKELKVVLIK